MKRVLGCIRRADERYRMIHPGDKICVGVSGGKDSLLLLYGLKLYQKFCHTPFELIGVMVHFSLAHLPAYRRRNWHLAALAGCRVSQGRSLNHS